MDYIIVTRSTDVFLVGPFQSNEEAADYGAVAQAKAWKDDPRWQTINLLDTFGLRIVAPANYRNTKGAYARACRPLAA